MLAVDGFIAQLGIAVVEGYDRFLPAGEIVPADGGCGGCAECRADLDFSTELRPEVQLVDVAEGIVDKVPVVVMVERHDVIVILRGCDETCQTEFQFRCVENISCFCGIDCGRLRVRLLEVSCTRCYEDVFEIGRTCEHGCVQVDVIPSVHLIRQAGLHGIVRELVHGGSAK